MGDYHVHLHPHLPTGPDDPDPGTFPRELIERYVEQAAARGVGDVCFTEHLYRVKEAADVLGEFWIGEEPEIAQPSIDFVHAERDIAMEDYVAAVTSARDDGWPVLLGLEIDYFPETIEAVNELLAPYPWDVLLGSVHWIGGFGVDVSAVASEYERRGVARVYEDYFALESTLAASGAVDVLAHVDLPKKHGHRLPEEPVEHYEGVARAAASSGTAVEVSSAGLFHPCAEIYPTPAFLDALHAAEVPITLASDAHRPGEVGRAFSLVVAAARSAGYTHYSQFRARRGVATPLPDIPPQPPPAAAPQSPAAAAAPGPWK